ncbi:MAG TPA: hypothetical protein VF974_00980 [Patescibacteria group bacterium]
MMVNNQETNEGDKAFYVDQDGAIYEAVIKSVNENGEASLDIIIDSYPIEVVDVPHNTSPEKHSWNHPRSAEEVATHYEPDFYG